MYIPLRWIKKKKRKDFSSIMTEALGLFNTSDGAIWITFLAHNLCPLNRQPTNHEARAFYCLSISVISFCRVPIVVLFLYSFVYVHVLGDVIPKSKEPFTWTAQISCVNHGITKVVDK